MFQKSRFNTLLQNAVSDPDLRQASVAWNLLHDWRISEQRIKEFEAFLAHKALRVKSWQDFRAGLALYSAEKVRDCSSSPGLPSPDFLAPSNESNWYGNGTLTTPGPQKRLVTVVGLNRLATYRLFPMRFRDYGSLDATTRLPLTDWRWLDKKLTGDILPQSTKFEITEPQSNIHLQKIVSSMSEAIERPDGMYEPIWVTLASDLEKLAGDDPLRWRELIGVPNNTVDPQWLMFLVYPVKSLRTAKLVRPTQLEAGTTSEHFPHPHHQPHGRAMDMSPDRWHCPLPEYIHTRLDLRKELANSKTSPIKFCVRVPPSINRNLQAAQRSHLRNLEKHFPPLTPWKLIFHPAEGI